MVSSTNIKPRIGLMPDLIDINLESDSAVVVDFQEFVGTVVGASSQWMRIEVQKDTGESLCVTLIPLSKGEMSEELLGEIGNLTSFKIRQSYLEGLISGLKDKQFKEVNVKRPYEIAYLYCERIRVSPSGIDVLYE